TRPVIPNVDGLDGVEYLTNATVMQLSELPEHLLILGGGYVGLEFGQMFRRFGSRVTVVHQNGQILPREDADVPEELQKALEDEGIHFLLNANTSRVEKRGREISLVMDAGRGSQTVTGSHLLVATGRRPNTDDLGLEHTGVELDPKGFLRVNSRLE